MIGPIFFALFPIFLLIALGHAMRRRSFLPDAFWPQAERLCYTVLMPALFLHGLATADLTGISVSGLVSALLIPIILVSLLLILLNRFLAANGPAFTSVFQGAIRFNNFVAISAAVGLYGQPAIALAAVATAAIVPTVNVLSVLVLSRYGSARSQTAEQGIISITLRVLRDIASNPLIVACTTGILLQVSGAGLPPGLESTFKALGHASLPLGLLCVGAALNWEILGTGLRSTLSASFFKFVIMPFATALACFWLGLDTSTAAVAVLFQAVPTASSSYVLARRLGGDAELMAGIVAFQTVLGFVTIPIVLLLFGLSL